MEPTDEQIELAAKTAYEKVNLQEFGPLDNPDRWDRISESMRESCREAMRIGAPFLQVAWELPNYDETELAIGLTDSSGALPHSRTRDRILLEHFVITRNAALRPKPFDPRREKIARAIDGACFTGPSALDRLTDRILAALDAKE